MSFDGNSGPEGWDDTVDSSVVYVDPTPTSQGSRRDKDPWTIAIGLLGGALIGTGVTLAVLGFAGIFEEPTPPTVPPPPVLTIPTGTTFAPALAQPGTASDVANKAIPSIVAVEVSSLLGEGSGSGVVFTSDGYVISNHHVVDGASEVTVVFADGGRYPAEIVGSDPLTDLAVIKIERSGLRPIVLGASSELRIGQPAIAVGNPLALAGGPSVTLGIISALNRSLEIEAGNVLYGLVQTDAPITRGSSGGALLDASSRLIGITTAIAVSDVGAEGLGFAIPVDIAREIAADLIRDGEVSHALLGVSGQTAFAEEGGASFPVGVQVNEMLDNSAYELSGGQINDVILSMDGTPIGSLEQLLTELRSRRAFQDVTIRVARSDSDLDLSVTLGQLNP